MTDLGGLAPDTWWKALSLIGGAMAAAAVGVGATGFALLGFGVALFGIGEWMRQKVAVQFVPPGDGLPGGLMQTPIKQRFKLGDAFQVVSVLLSLACLASALLPVVRDP